MITLRKTIVLCTVLPSRYGSKYNFLHVNKCFCLLKTFVSFSKTFCTDSRRTTTRFYLFKERWPFETTSDLNFIRLIRSTKQSTGGVEYVYVISLETILRLLVKIKGKNLCRVLSSLPQYGLFLPTFTAKLKRKNKNRRQEKDKNYIYLCKVFQPNI